MEEREVVVIGGGPAGLSAAIFTQIDGWNTLVLEGSWTGGQGAIAYTVSNYPGFPAGDGSTLIENMEKQATSPPPMGVGAEIRHERVTSLNAEDMIVTTGINQYKAQAIILATGSNMQRLGVPGEDAFAGKGVTYYAKSDVSLLNGKKVLIVGGGNSTAKSALLAKTVASEVTLIHRRESLRTYPVMAERLRKGGVRIQYNTELSEVKGSNHVETAVLVNNKTGERNEIPIDWIVICIGTQPDTSLAKSAGLMMEGNFVIINEKMMTSKPGIFACGEITGCDRHLISSASEGASAGMAVSEYLAMEKVKRSEMFEGAKNGKYADEYLAMLR
jgi:thioredoxin reductase (NADPH)